MDSKARNAGKMTDNELNEALEAYEEEDLDGLSIKNQRLAKIQDYEEAALSRSDPFAAVIGAGGASLQRVFEQLGAAIIDRLDDHAHTVDEIREIAPEIRLLVKIRNSIETDLALQLHDSEQRSAVFRHGMRGNGFDSKLPARKHELMPKPRHVND